MRLVFTSPYQAEGDLIDYGLHVVRGVPFTVSDELGKTLLKHPHFKSAEPPKEAPKPEPPKAAEEQK